MSGERPVWLSDEPELAALLNVVLDRFDHQSGESRRKAIVLPLDRHLPSLARADAAADQVWSLLQALQQQDLLSIRPGKRSVYDPPWQGARAAFAPESEDTLRAWFDRPPTQRAMDLWRRAVDAHAPAFPGGIDMLSARRILIGDRTADEIVAALAGIAAIQGPITLRQLSAQAFWGDSKVLDDRHDLIAALFPALEIQDRAIVVTAFLPQSCTGVLFIENQDTYVAATRGVPDDARDLALVYASGFRSTAERIRRRAGSLLHYAGPGASPMQSAFENWWFGAAEPPGPCHFWGDLDFAGMQILKTLRARFGEVTAWQPGYLPMLEALAAIHGASARQHDDSGQVDPGVTGCAFADEQLLPAIRRHGGLHQEWSSPG